MLIEICNAGFINKGAELMLYAAMDRLQKGFPGAGFVMAPGNNNSAAPYARRAAMGFFQKAWLRCFGIQWGGVAALIPGNLREMYGIVLDREIDVVIDASGFAYSDECGPKSSRVLAENARRWHGQGARVILLPQAMGPFNTPGIKKYIRIAADNADLIFPRDMVSYRHLTAVVGERPGIQPAPDFTNLIGGIVPEYMNPAEHRFCIIPNYRMIDKTPPDQGEAYLPFMVKCARYLVEKKCAPFLLVHEGEDDLRLAKQISEKAPETPGGRLPVIRETHPLKIKGIIGACEGTIGSRFHGLVSALSQGVPALATGWSHKYEMHFHDYGFGEGLVDVMAPDDTIREKIDLIVDPGSRKAIEAKLYKNADRLKMLAEEMWDNVFEVINQ